MGTRTHTTKYLGSESALTYLGDFEDLIPEFILRRIR